MEEVPVQIIWTDGGHEHLHVRLRRRPDGGITVVLKNPTSLAEEELDYEEFIGRQPEVIRRAFEEAYQTLVAS